MVAEYNLNYITTSARGQFLYMKATLMFIDE